MIVIIYLVDNENAVLLVELDDRSGLRSSGRLGDLDTFLDDHLGILLVRGRRNGGEESEVDGTVKW